MTLSDLLNEFNVVIDTAEGLTELRSLILGLAVRGKLVPQDPNDEPASELLKKIEAEKQRLYAEGEVRKPKKVTKIHEEDYPFEIPSNWVWTNLDEAGLINPRNSALDENEASFISMSSISEDYFAEHESEQKLWKEIKSGYTHFAENDVGLAKITPCFQNGKSAIFRGLKNGIGAGTTELYIFRSIVDGLIPEYVYSFLRTPDFVNQGVEGMKGTAGQQRVSKNYFEHRPFPLPPSTEQHRIVAKIEALFAEVNELEAKLNRQTKLDSTLQLAVNAEVQQAPDAKASKAAWNVITSNFETLYHTPESIDNLKKNILNEAVRGRLVPQNPNDEPASELLKKIEAEKECLYEAGEIRKPKALPPVTEEEIPFEIPENWEWCYMDNLATKVTDGEHSTPERSDEGFYLLSARNITDEGIALADVDYVPKHEFVRIRKRCNPDKGDVLLSCSGSVGRTAIVDEDNKYVMVRSAALIKSDWRLLNDYYLMYLIKSPLIQNQILAKIKTTAQSNLFLGKIKELVVSLPPLEEQHRIVRRIEELFDLCDRFKAQLEQRQAVNEKLVKGLVAEVLEGV